MTPDREPSPATAAPPAPVVRDAAPLHPELTLPLDVPASRWRRLIGGVLDFIIALVLSAWAGTVASGVVELGTKTSASIVLAVGWIGIIVYLASPWTLARSALGMHIVHGRAIRGASLVRGLVRVVLLPVNIVMLLVANRHIGDIATRSRIVRTRGSWLCAALIPIVIGVGYVGATRAFLRAATHSDAWTKARQATGTEIDLRRFVFGNRSAVFESSWGHQELVLLGGAWYVIRAQQGASTGDSDSAVQVSLASGALIIGESRVSRVETIDVSNVRAELIANLTKQVEARGMALRDVECDDITGPQNECRAQLAQPGDQLANVRIAIKLDDKAGMVGQIRATR